MSSVDVRVRDGEATLVEKLFEDASLNVVCDEAKRRGLVFDGLEFTSITKDKEKYKGEESLVQAPYIRIKSSFDSREGRFGHLIVKKPGDETYGLWSYHWTP